MAEAVDDEPLIDPVLGQPRMVDDPRITLEQAANVLGKTIAQVRRYLSTGRLQRHGPPRNTRPVLLSEAEALRDKGDPITIEKAAQKLARSAGAIRELIEDGHLQLVPGTKNLLYPADVEALAATISGWAIRRPIGPAGYLDTNAASRRLGISPSYLRQLAAAERMPAVFQDGQYWFHPTHVENSRRARRARRTRAVSRPYRTPRRTRSD